MQFFFLSLNGVKPGVALHPYFKLFTLGGMDTKKKRRRKEFRIISSLGYLDWHQSV